MMIMMFLFFIHNPSCSHRRVVVALRSDGFAEFSVGNGTAGSEAVVWKPWATLANPCNTTPMSQLSAPQCK